MKVQIERLGDRTDAGYFVIEMDVLPGIGDLVEVDSEDWGRVREIAWTIKRPYEKPHQPRPETAQVMVTMPAVAEVVVRVG